MSLKIYIKEILENSELPMSVDEITEKLLEQGIFKFKSKSPRGVVSATLKRNAEGVHSCKPVKNKSFNCISKNTYEMISK